MTQGSSHYSEALVRWCVSHSVSRRDWGWHLPSDWADVRQTCRSDLGCWMRATRLTSAEEVVGGVVKARQVCGQLPAALSQSASCPREDFKRLQPVEVLKWCITGKERINSSVSLLSVVQPGEHLIYFFLKANSRTIPFWFMDVDISRLQTLSCQSRRHANQILFVIDFFFFKWWWKVLNTKSFILIGYWIAVWLWL